MSIGGVISRRRAALDVGVQVVGRSANVVLGAVVAVLLARSLGARGYGEWASMFAIVTIVGYIGALGLTQVTLRQIAADPGREAEWFGALITVRMLLALPAMILVLVAEVLVAHDREMRLAGIVVAFVVLVGPPTALMNVYTLRVRNAVPVAVDLANSVVWTAAVAILFAAHAGLVAYAVAFLALTVVRSVIQVGLGLRLVRPAYAAVRELWSPLLRLAVPVAIGGMLVLTYGSVDQVIVFRLAGAKDAGQYAAAYRLLDAAQFLPAAVLTTLFPLLSAADDDARLRRLVQLAADHLAMVSLPILGFAVAASSPLVDLLFGRSFAPAAGALPVLMGAFVAICFGYLAGNLTIVLGLQGRFVWLALGALVFNVALNLPLVHRYGFLAAAWVTLATEILVCSATLAICLRRIEMRLRVGRMARAVAAAAGMTLVVWALARAGAGIAVLAASSVVYLPLLLATGAMRPAELRALVVRGDDLS